MRKLAFVLLLLGAATCESASPSAASGDPCRDAEDCKVFGYCVSVTDQWGVVRCEVGSAEDCAASKACAVAGACSVVDGKPAVLGRRCAPTTDAECQASTKCTEPGAEGYRYAYCYLSPIATLCVSSADVRKACCEEAWGPKVDLEACGADCVSVDGTCTADKCW